jgi:hypothetical protein
LFGSAWRRLFGSGGRRSAGFVRGLLEDREKSAGFFETPYFSAIYPHPQGI